MLGLSWLGQGGRPLPWGNLQSFPPLFYQRDAVTGISGYGLPASAELLPATEPPGPVLRLLRLGGASPGSPPSAAPPHPWGDLPDWAAQPREPAGPSGAAWPGPASCSEAGPHLTLGAGLFFLQNGSPAGAAEHTAPSLERDGSSANGSVMIGEPQPGAKSPPPLTGHPKTWLAPKPRGAQRLPRCRRATGAARRACPPHGSPLGNLSVSLKRRAAQGGMGDRCTPGPR